MVSLRAKIAGYTVTVRTHTAPHLDELLALLLAMMFASVEWVTLHCPNLVLELGTGRGEFDEHPDLEQGRARVAGETCATLVAKSLGVEQHPIVVRILEYATAQDLEGQAAEDDFAVAIKSWNYILDYHGQDRTPEVADWAFTGLSALMAAEVVRYRFRQTLDPATADQVMAERDRIAGSPFRLATMIPLVRQHLGNTPAADAWETQACQIGVISQQLFELALTEIAESATTHVIGTGERRVKLCLIESRNPLIMRAYRSIRAGEKRSNALLQFKPSGHFLAGVSMKSGLQMTDAAALLRNAVMGAKIRRGQLRKEEVPSRKQLALEGRLPGAEEIYFFPKGNMIFNGSITDPDIAPLTGQGQLLNKEIVTRMVVEGIRKAQETKLAGE